MFLLQNGEGWHRACYLTLELLTNYEQGIFELLHLLYLLFEYRLGVPFRIGQPHIV